MKNVLKTIFFLSTLFVVVSCAKDQGNYDYSKVNRVQVDVKDTVYTVQQLDEINVKPTLVETLPGNDEYTYSWIAYPTTVSIGEAFFGEASSAVTVLSTAKDLKAVVTLSPKDYYLQYTVTNKVNGVKTIKRYLMKVVGAFYEGWLVLHNKANTAKLSFIRRDNELFMDPVEQINKLEFNGKGLGVYSSVITAMSQINVYTDQGTYQFNADDFTLEKQDADLYHSKISYVNPFHSVNHINTDQYLISDGKVYATIAPNFGVPGKYSASFSGEPGYIFPFLFCGDMYYMSYYDNKNMRFLLADFNSRYLVPFSNGLAGSYEVANVGKTMIAADLGYDNVYYAVMKDANGFYCYLYNPNSPFPAEQSQKIAQSPDIENATAFAASSMLQHLYYVAGNKIYLYDIAANSSRKLYEFPSSKSIKDIKMLKGKRWSTNVDLTYNKQLVVATNEEQAGEVYYFDLSPTGDIVKNTYSKVYKGFGEIVQLNYRNPNQD